MFEAILEFIAIISLLCFAVGIMGLGMAAAEKAFDFAHNNIPAFRACNRALFGDVFDE